MKQQTIHLLVSVVLQDQLFEEQERPLVVDLLSHLHTGLPCILRSQPGTIGTLSTVNDQEQDKRLLQDGVGQDFLLDRYFDL